MCVEVDHDVKEYGKERDIIYIYICAEQKFLCRRPSLPSPSFFLPSISLGKSANQDGHWATAYIHGENIRGRKRGPDFTNDLTSNCARHVWDSWSCEGQGVTHVGEFLAKRRYMSHE